MNLTAFCLACIACIALGVYVAVQIVWPLINSAVTCTGPLCQ